MYKWKKYFWVSYRRRWSVAVIVLSESWCLLILLWSLVSFNVVIVCRALVLTRLWVSLHLVFAIILFSFFVYWRLFSFYSVEVKMGWRLCFGFVILFENHVSGFRGCISRFNMTGFILMLLERVRVDGGSYSSYLKDFIHRGCFLHYWCTMIDLCRLFLLWSGLRLKSQDHCDFVDSVCNWLLWLERVFMACWFFEDSCCNLGCLCW